jgi:hypothetical protein
MERFDERRIVTNWLLSSILVAGMALIVVEILKINVYRHLLEELKILNEVLSGLRAKISELARGKYFTKLERSKGRLAMSTDDDHRSNREYRFLRSIFERPIPPNDHFEDFVVGRDVENAKAQLFGLIKEIAHGAPSQITVIVGDNGNGKTLVNNWVKLALSKENYEPNSEPEAQASPLNFYHFFSHFTAHSDFNTTQAGYEVVRSCQFHYRRPASYTFSIVADRVFKDFYIKYKPPWWTKVLDLKTFVEFGKKAGEAALDHASFGLFGAGVDALLSDDAFADKADEILAKSNSYVRGFLTAIMQPNDICAARHAAVA